MIYIVVIYCLEMAREFDEDRIGVGRFHGLMGESAWVFILSAYSIFFSRNLSIELFMYIQGFLF